MPDKKTWKREVAAVLLLWLAYLMETKDVELVELVVWPVFSYAGLAFGLDVYSNVMRSVPTVASDGRRT